jgi:hypothetical protein
MATVHNIPSASDFKKSVGRYYSVQRLVRGRQQALDRIAELLALLEPQRSARSTRALELLRHLRRCCAQYLWPPSYSPNYQDLAVSRLAANINNQIECVVTHLGSTSKGRAGDLERARVGLDRDNQVVLRDNNGQIGRTVGASYNVERFTRAHYPSEIQEKHQSYLKRFPRSNLSIEEFVEKLLKPLLADDPNCATVSDGKVELHNRVKYCNGAERLGYKIKLTGDGRLRWAHDDSLLDTSGMHSIATGQGWGVFVVDFAQDFYVNAHQKDQFHHSSFLAGAPVFSAGELCVSQGVLVGVTNKTGHYKSGPAELHRALLLLQRLDRKKGWVGGVGAGMGKVAVSDPFLAPGKWYSAEAVLAASGNVLDSSMQTAVRVQQPSASNMVALSEAVKGAMLTV